MVQPEKLQKIAGVRLFYPLFQVQKAYLHKREEIAEMWNVNGHLKIKHLNTLIYADF